MTILLTCLVSLLVGLAAGLVLGDRIGRDHITRPLRYEAIHTALEAGDWASLRALASEHNNTQTKRK